MLNKQHIREFYIVEKILDRRTSGNGSYEYFIKWKNYPHRDNTWEPLAHLSTVSSLVENFNEEFQERERILKSKKLYSSLAYSNKEATPRHKVGRHNMHQKMSQGQLQQNSDPQILRKDCKNSTKKNSFTYRFENSDQNQTSRCLPSCKNSNQSQNLSNNNYENRSLENSIFKNISSSDRKEYSEESQNFSIQETPFDEPQLEQILIIERTIGQEMLQSDSLQPDQNILRSFQDSSQQIIPLISSKYGAQFKEVSLNSSYFHAQDEEKRLMYVNKTAESNIQKNFNISDQSGEKPFHSGSMDGSTHSGERDKGREPELQRSRNKRNREQRYLGENKRRRRLKRNRKIEPEQRIRIDQILPSMSIPQQLQHFNHKQFCQPEFQADNTLSFKLQNQTGQTIKISLKQVQRLYPKWLKEYYQSYI